MIRYSFAVFIITTFIILLSFIVYDQHTRGPISRFDSMGAYIRLHLGPYFDLQRIRLLKCRRIIIIIIQTDDI